MRNGTPAACAFATLLATLAFVQGGESRSWKDNYLRVGDIKIHYLEAGTGDRVLLFIPGWAMPAEIWKEQIPYFSSRGFRVIAMDPRSQGETTKSETGNTYQQHAADLHAFLQALKIERCSLVAWAAGVTTLLEYLQSPEVFKPEKIILVEGGCAGIKLDDYPGSITLQQSRKILLGFQEDRKKAMEQHVRGLFREGQPEILIKTLLDGSQKTPTAAALSLYFDQVTGDRRAALKHISVPTLIVTTPEGKAVGEYMKSRIQRCALQTIENAGSALFLDRPQAFNQALETFLGEH